MLRWSRTKPELLQTYQYPCTQLGDKQAQEIEPSGVEPVTKSFQLSVALHL